MNHFLKMYKPNIKLCMQKTRGFLSIMCIFQRKILEIIQYYMELSVAKEDYIYVWCLGFREHDLIKKRPGKKLSSVHEY